MFGWSKREIYTIYDPEHEKKRKLQRRTLIAGILVSLLLTAFPVFQDARPKWAAYTAARKLSTYLSMIRNQAILKKIPIEVRFIAPNQIEVYETTSCGPKATSKKLWDLKLSDFAESVEFVDPQWVQTHLSSHDAIFSHYCYDPLYGSSLAAEGYARGSVFLAHRQSIDGNFVDGLVQIFLVGASGDVDFD